MAGETALNKLLKHMKPELNPGEYVFCTLSDPQLLKPTDIICLFREQEAWTVIINRKLADEQKLSYHFIASWITLSIHSSLEAVGLTAAVSTALAEKGISCNVVAAFYHDHLFVGVSDTAAAIAVLQSLSK